MTRRMVASLLALTLALTLALAARGYAQESDEGEPYVIAQRYMVPSAVLEEDRPIAVSLPPGYDTTAAYPVVYVMDGFGHLTHTVGAVRFLRRTIGCPTPSSSRSQHLREPHPGHDPAFERP